MHLHKALRLLLLAIPGSGAFQTSFTEHHHAFTSRAPVCGTDTSKLCMSLEDNNENNDFSMKDVQRSMASFATASLFLLASTTPALPENNKISFLQTQPAYAATTTTTVTATAPVKAAPKAPEDPFKSLKDNVADSKTKLDAAKEIVQKAQKVQKEANSVNNRALDELQKAKKKAENAKGKVLVVNDKFASAQIAVRETGNMQAVENLKNDLNTAKAESVTATKNLDAAKSAQIFTGKAFEKADSEVNAAINAKIGAEKTLKNSEQKLTDAQKKATADAKAAEKKQKEKNEKDKKARKIMAEKKAKLDKKERERAKKKQQEAQKQAKAQAEQMKKAEEMKAKEQKKTAKEKAEAEKKKAEKIKAAKKKAADEKAKKIKEEEAALKKLREVKSKIGPDQPRALKAVEKKISIEQAELDRLKSK